MTSGSTPGAITRVTGAAILDREVDPTCLLVAQRAYPDKLRGLWEFPGGKQEPGEPARDALVRECSEELGVMVRLLTEVKPPRPEGWPLAGTAAMRVFTAVIASGGPPRAGEDHLRLAWLPVARPERILELDWIPADLPIVRALLGMLGRPIH